MLRQIRSYQESRLFKLENKAGVTRSQDSLHQRTSQQTTTSVNDDKPHLPSLIWQHNKAVSHWTSTNYCRIMILHDCSSWFIMIAHDCSWLLISLYCTIIYMEKAMWAPPANDDNRRQPTTNWPTTFTLFGHHFYQAKHKSHTVLPSLVFSYSMWSCLAFPGLALSFLSSHLESVYHPMNIAHRPLYNTDE
jgi:hypothetical protein